MSRKMTEAIERTSVGRDSGQMCPIQVLKPSYLLGANDSKRSRVYYWTTAFQLSLSCRFICHLYGKTVGMDGRGHCNWGVKHRLRLFKPNIFLAAHMWAGRPLDIKLIRC